MLDTLRLAVIVPLMAAVASGCLFGLLVWVLSAWQRWPSVYGIIAATAAAFITWLALRHARIAEEAKAAIAGKNLEQMLAEVY